MPFINSNSNVLLIFRPQDTCPGLRIQTNKGNWRYSGKNLYPVYTEICTNLRSILHELFMMASGENFYSFIPFHFISATHFK